MATAAASEGGAARGGVGGVLGALEAPGATAGTAARGREARCSDWPYGPPGGPGGQSVCSGVGSPGELRAGAGWSGPARGSSLAVPRLERASGSCLRAARGRSCAKMCVFDVFGVNTVGVVV